MYRQPKKIPTILGLLFLFMAITGVVYLDRSQHGLNIKAEAKVEPLEISFTNITDSSFTVSWLTSSPVIGMLKLSTDPYTGIYLDDLDNDNTPRPRTTHYVTLKNLEKNKTYTVKIINGDESCKIKENCITYTVKTAISLPSSFPLPPARGTIVDAQGMPADQAIVYLTVGKSAPLSSRVDRSGLWVIPLNNLYSQDFFSRPQLSDNDLIQISAKTDPADQVSAVVDLESIRQNLTIPTMILGHSYNFINLIDKKGQLASLLEKKTLGVRTEKTRLDFDFLFPEKDGDFTTDPQPRIRGIALPDSQLTITINSQSQIGKITASSDGTWVFRPIKPLTPGRHTVTIEGLDASGNPISLSRNFIVLKSGESVLGEATPSASLTPTISVTSTPSPTLAISPTVPIISPTPTTLAPTTTLQVTPPPSGMFQPAVLLLVGSAVFLTLGLGLLIL